MVAYTVENEDGSPMKLLPGKPVSLDILVPESGSYHLFLEYRSLSDIVLKSTMTVELGDAATRVELFSLWKDVSKDYRKDRFGNELPAEQEVSDGVVADYVKDQADVSQRPFVFKLPAGASRLVLTSEDTELDLYSVKLVRREDPPSYGEYAADKAALPQGTELIVIEGEDYRLKSDSYIRAGAERNPALYPYDYRVKRLNVLDGYSFSRAGQKVLYSFEVKEPGIYCISFRYAQNYKEGVPVYCNVRIDGHELFDEMRSVPFPYTGVRYANKTIGTGNGYAGIYLEKGHHTLTLELDGTPVAPYIKRLREILADINEIGLDILKIAGRNASVHRTWDVESYLPGVIDQLEGYREELLDIYSQIGRLQDGRPAAALNLKLAADNLGKLLKNPSKLPGRLSLLSEGSGSVAQMLADLVDRLTYQNLSVDRIYVHGAGKTLPKAEAGLFTRLADGIRRFFHALFSGERQEDHDGKVLKVWVNRPIHYVEIMQAMADASYTSEKGINVRFSVMPSEQKIILANATDSAPDAVLGVGAGLPFDLGIRGAVADLMQFEDFPSYIQKEYNIQSLVPYVYGGKVFGATETQEFYVLMMRTDIMDKLNLEVPRTWDDVADMMPILQRHSMNFYLQLSGYSGTKPLYTTVPFIQQANGSLYSSDGLATAINSPESLRGFEALTDLYRIYSVTPVVSSFYNSFRYGQIPIGIASFTDYVKIRSAAPEIAGNWAIAPAPGFIGKDGEIRNGTTGAATACIIMEQSDMKEEAWDFLKWWLSSEVQIKFGNTLQTTYGPDYLWNSANIEAFKQLSFPDEDKAVILDQWGHMEEIYRHPALYAIERELSNAWTDVVLNGVPVRIALDDAALEINREFARKLVEFGYMERDGTVKKTYDLKSIEEIINGVRP